MTSVLWRTGLPSAHQPRGMRRPLLNVVPGLLLGMLLGLSLGLLLPNTASAKGADPAPWRRLSTGGGSYEITVRTTTPPAVGGYQTWAVAISGRGSAGLDPSLTVRGGMPGHGHGLPSEPQVRRLAPGQFVLEGLQFNMPGEWVLHFDVVGNRTRRETATLVFEVPG